MNSPAIEPAGQLGKAVVAPIGEIAQRTFDGFEQLAHLNLQTVKTTLAEQQAIAEAAVTSNSLEWVLSLPPAQMQAGLKKALAYWRHVSTITIDTVADTVGSGWYGLDQYAQWSALLLGNAANAASESAGATPASTDTDSDSGTDLSVVTEGAVASSGGRPAGKRKPVADVDEDGNAQSTTKQ